MSFNNILDKSLKYNIEGFTYEYIKDRWKSSFEYPNGAESLLVGYYRNEDDIVISNLRYKDWFKKQLFYYQMKCIIDET